MVTSEFGFSQDLSSSPTRKANLRQFGKTSSRLGSAFFFLLSVVSLSLAQTDPAAGIPLFHTRLGGQYDSFDPATSAILLNIPVRNKPGKIPFSYSLLGNSHAWIVVSGQTSQWAVATQSSSVGSFGMPQLTIVGTPLGTLGSGPYVGLETYMTCNGFVGDPIDSNYAVVDSYGTSHPLPSTMKVDLYGCISNHAVGTTTDGSGYTMQIDTNSSGITYLIYDRSGNRLNQFPRYPFTFTDADQTTESINLANSILSYTDIFGTTALTVSQAGTSHTYTYTGGDGNASDGVTVQYTTNMHIKTVFNCPGVSDNDYPNGITLPSTVTLPDSSKITFTYETTPGYSYPYTTGRVASITYPGGGSVTYAYSGGNNGVNCASQVVPTVTRTLNDNNGHQSQWTYVNSNSRSTAGVFAVTEIDPANNYTVYTFSGGFETERQVYNGAISPSNLLQTVITCYNARFSNCPNAPPPYNSGNPAPITQTDVYTSFNNSSTASLVETKFNNVGLVTEVKRYDFIEATPPTGAPAGSPLSDTTISYDSAGSCGTLSNPYMYDRPCSVITVNASGTPVSKTNYTYSSTGHPVQSQRWVTGTTYLTSSASYNSNGTINTATDANTGVRTYGYDGSCNSLVPTSTKLPTVNSITIATSQTWDCKGGVITSTTDANTPANVTTFKYNDPLWRQTEADYPDGGVIKTSYNGTAIPPNVQANRLVDSSGRRLTTQTNVDGLGRPLQQQLTSDPNGTVYIDTTYDMLGQVASVSNPYYTTKDATYGIAKYAYDALGRATAITNPDGSQRLASYSGAWSKVQDEGNGSSAVTRAYQHDGLGRPITVCEISSAAQQGGGSPASCGAFSSTGYLTGYSYDALGNITGVTQGSETRTYGYDGLSRLTSEVNPEWTGGITYAYDASGQQGDLSQRIAPAPNQIGSATVTTSYAYDKLHRLNSKTYSDGTTPGAYYYYDQSAPWGVALTNYMGRLTTEGTYNGSWVNKAEFNYDSMGRSTLNAQAFATQYNLNYTYDYLGDRLTSTNGLGLTLTYGYNQAAELTSVMSSLSDASHPSSLFSTPIYNALGALVSDHLGNGSEAFTYDARGRLLSGNTLQPDLTHNTPGQGWVFFSGQEQSVQIPSTFATGSVQIGGADKFILQPDNCGPGGPKCVKVYDQGTVTVTVNGANYTVNYGPVSGQPATILTIASDLTNALNGGSLVNASYDSTGKITLTAKQKGACCNFSLSTSVTYDSGNFTSASFKATCGSSITTCNSSLTGGTSTTLYDTGNVYATVGSTQESVSYGQSDTPSSIASGLANKFNNDGSSLVTATVSGATVNLTSKATGSGSNYPLSTSSTTSQSQYFSQSSFGGSPSGPTLVGGADGQARAYSIGLTYAPNNNVLSANDSVTGNWTYVYDDFNRLKSANGSQSYSFDYDRYGNRWHETPGAQYTFTGNNNHIDSGSGVSYDARGNMSKDGLGHSYFYDAENRLIQVDGTLGQCSTSTACYVYDAAGRRASRTVGASTVNYLYDLGGKQVTEVSSTGAWNRGEVYVGNHHLTTYAGGTSGTTYFDVSDWLGTERARTGVSGTAETCTSLPFGDAQTCSGSEPSPMHFTGQQFDSEDNLTHFPYRQYSATQGRWGSPDPAGLGAADLSNPQTWNQYTYVANNPLAYVDPNGLRICSPGDSVEWCTSGGSQGGAPPCYMCGGPGGGGNGYNGSLGSGGPSGSDFSGGSGFGGSVTFSGDLCNSDFMPCGLPMPSLWQSIWSDVLGLPSGLNCPQVGGLSDFFCGGVSPIMDVGPSLNPQAILDCYHAYNKSEPAPVRFFSLLSFTSLNDEWKAAWKELSIYLPFKIGGLSLLKLASHGAADTAEAAATGATVGSTTIDGLGLTSCLPAGVTVGPPKVSAGHGPF
jgi:RHS repeat-associated protein